MSIKLKQPNNNYIPDMTHPYGKSWDQPDRSEITIDDKHAMMSEKTFNKLLNYSHSIPSAAYEGKMWRGQYQEGGWYLRWYGLSHDPDMISNHQRDIIII